MQVGTGHWSESYIVVGLGLRLGLGLVRVRLGLGLGFGPVTCNRCRLTWVKGH